MSVVEIKRFLQPEVLEEVSSLYLTLLPVNRRTRSHGMLVELHTGVILEEVTRNIKNTYGKCVIQSVGTRREERCNLQKILVWADMNAWLQAFAVLSF